MAVLNAIPTAEGIAIIMLNFIATWLLYRITSSMPLTLAAVILVIIAAPMADAIATGTFVKLRYLLPYLPSKTDIFSVVYKAPGV